MRYSYGLHIILSELPKSLDLDLLEIKSIGTMFDSNLSKLILAWDPQISKKTILIFTFDCPKQDLNKDKNYNKRIP